MARKNAPALHLIPVARHGRSGLLRTTALQAVALFGLSAMPAQAQAPLPANAQPRGGSVVGGSASIAQTQTTTSVSQTSSRAAIDWRSFDVGSQQTVTITAPRASDVTLNRVTGPDPSRIDGRIIANDQVVLVNRSGVSFSKGAEVDTAGLVVSASGISPAAFMAGSMAFDQPPNPGAKISNAGHITVRESGLAALVAPQVANSGVITARMGHVVLAGAEAHTVDLYGDGMVSLNVTKQVTKASLGNGQTVDALVTNTGAVRADGGTVELTAQAVDGLVTTLVSAGGKISADTAGQHRGTVIVHGVGGDVQVSGDVSASGKNAGSVGGRIEVNATGQATLRASATLDASGDAGGGTIALGTTLARASGGPGVSGQPTARTVAVLPGARVSADATRQGRGGKVTVLSTDATAMAGTISARGGPVGGDGGQAEVSGGAHYSLSGGVDVGAPKGKAGGILIDPVDITISTAADSVTISGTGTLAFDTAAGTGNIKNSTLSALTGTVVIQATNNLTVSAPVDSAASSLTLQAGNNLSVAAGSGITVSNGSLTLSAADPASPAQVASGALTIGGVLNAKGAVALSAGTGGVTITTTVASQGGVSVKGASITLGDASNAAVINGGTGQVVSLQTDAFAFGTKAGGGIASGGGVVAIAPNTAGNAVAVGGAAGAGTLAVALNSLNLSTGTVLIGATGGSTRAGSINFGTVTAFGTLDVEATGNVGQSAAIAAAALVGKAGTVTLTDTGNQIDILGGLKATGALAVVDGKSLIVSGAVSGSTVGITVAADGGTLTLGDAGTGTAVIGSASTGTATLEADNLARGLAAGSVTATTVALTPHTSNTDVVVGTGGTFELPTLNAGTVVLGKTGGGSPINNITFAEVGFFGTAVLDLETAGNVSQTGGSIVAGGLVGGVGLAVALTEPTNAIPHIGPIRGNGGVTLATAGSLSVDGFVVGSSVSLTAGTSIAQTAGSIDAGSGAIALTAKAGSITQVTDTKLVTTGAVTASATGGEVRLDSAANQVGGILGGGSDTAYTLTDSTGVIVTGKLAAPLVAVAVTAAGQGVQIGDIGNAGTIDAGATGSVVIQADKVSRGLSGGTITGNSVQLAPFTANTDLAVGGVLPPYDPSVIAPTGTLILGLATGTTIRNLTFNGPVSLPGVTLDLETTGAVTEALLTSISVGTLKGSVGSIDLTNGGTGNTLSTIGPLASVGGIVLPAGGDVALVGTVQGTSVSITAGGKITQTSGTVQATSGALSLTANGGAISFSGKLIGGTVSLVADSSVTEGGAGVVQAATLTGSADVDATFDTASGNAVTTLGTFSAGGAFKLVNGGPLTVSGTVSGSAIALSSDSIAIGGSISTGGGLTLTSTVGDVTEQATGTISAATLTGTTKGSLLLGNAGNTIPELDAFASQGALTLTTTGALSVAGAVGASTTLTLSADSITETAAGIVSGGTLSGTAVNGAVFDTAANAVGTLMDFDGGTVLTLTNNGPLTLAGVDKAATVTLSVTGDVGGAGAIQATTLKGSATGKALFDGINTQVGTLSSFGAGGALSVTDGVNLTVVGTVGGGASTSLTVTPSGGSITLGAATLPGAVSASTGGTAALTADALLTGKAGGAVNAPGGTAQFSPETANTDLTLGGASGFGTPTFTADTLRIGTLSSTPVRNISIAGPVDYTTVKTLDLEASGAITQVSAGSLAANVLTGKAASLDLTTAATNAVGTLGPFATTGALALTDQGALTVAGAVSGTTVTLAAGGGAALTLGTEADPAVLTASAGDVVLQADQLLSGNASSSSSATGFTTFAPFTANTDVVIGGAGGSVLPTLVAGNLRLGLASGTTARAIALATPLDLGTTSLDLRATGTVSQSASSPVTAATIGGSVGALDFSAAANAIGSIGTITATKGGIAVRNAQTIDVAGTVTALSGLVALNATAGDITESSGRVVSDSLLAAAENNVSLTAVGNQVGTLTAGSATLAFTLVDSQSLTVAGNVTGETVSFKLAAGAALTLGDATTPGALTSTGGTGVTPLVTLQADQVLLGKAGGTVTASKGLVEIAPVSNIDFGSGAGGALQLPVVDAATLRIGAVGGVTTAKNVQFGAPVDIGAAGTLDLQAGGLVSQTAAGGVTAGTVTGTVGSLDLTLGTNHVATLATLASGGPLSFMDADPLSLAGSLSGTSLSITSAGDIAQANGAATASGTLALASTGGGIAFSGKLTGAVVSLTAGAGAITEGAAATVSAGTLTGSASGAATFDSTAGTGNQAGTLSGFSAGGALVLVDASPLALAGTVQSTGGDVTLTSSGAITQGGGLVSANGRLSLTGTAIAFAGKLAAGTTQLVAQTGSVAENAAGIVQTSTLSATATKGAVLLDTVSAPGTGNLVGTVSGIQSQGAVTLLNGQALTIADNVTSAAGNVSLATSQGALTTVAGVTISAPAGTTSLAGADGLVIGGVVTGPTVVLASSAGGVSETGTGVVNAATLLSGSAKTDVTLGAKNNVVPNLGTFLVGGTFTLLDSVPLSAAGTVNGSAIALTAPSISVGGALTSNGATTLVATTGSITEAGTITASVLTGSAVTTATLTQANAVDQLGPFAAGGTFKFGDSKAVQIIGDITSTAGDVAVTTTAGGITDAAAATIAANGTAALTSAGGIAFAGTVSAPSVTLSAASGDVTETVGASSTGRIVATTLTGAAPVGAIALDNPAGNSVTTLSDISGGTAVTFVNAGALTITGKVSSGTDSVAITTLAGALTQAAGSTITAANTLTLDAEALLSAGGLLTAPVVTLISDTAGIDQGSGTGMIQTGTLNASATGSVTFNGTNKIGALGNLSSGTAFSLTDASPLVVVGNVTATSIGLDAPSIAIGGTLTAPTVALKASAGDIVEVNGAETGSISTGLLTGSASGAVSLSGANAVGRLGMFTAGADLSLNDTAPLEITDTLASSGGSVRLTDTKTLTQDGGHSITAAGTIALAAQSDLAANGSLSAPAVALTSSTGGITQAAGGSIGTGVLSGSAARDVTLASTGNAILTLGSFAASGSLSVTDSVSLDVAGPVSATTLALVSAGNISESGTIAANLLQGSAAGTASFGGANVIPSVGPFTAGTSFALRTTPALTIVGNVAAPLVSLTSAGTISQGAGLVQAGTLTGSSGGDTTLPGANAVGSLGDFSAAGALVLNSTVDLALAGAVSATTIGLSAPAISETGSISASSLSATSPGEVMLTGTNAIAMIGPLTASTASIVDAGSLVLAGVTVAGDTTIRSGGTISATGSVRTGGTLLLTAAGDISETAAGSLAAAVLTGSSGGPTQLAAGTNSVGQVGDFRSGGAFSLADQTALGVSGTLTAPSVMLAALAGAITESGGIVTGPLTVSAAADVALTGGGNRIAEIAQATAGGSLLVTDGVGLVLSGALSAPVRTDLTVAGGITQTGGSIQTALLTGSTAGDALLNVAGGNAVAQVGAFASTGRFALTDARSLTIGGPLTASAIGLSVLGAGNSLALAGAVSAPMVDLAIAGDVTQGAGAITAATLTGMIGGAAALNGSNSIGQLGSFSTGGDLALTDAGALAVAGKVSGANITLAAGGTGLSIAGSLSTSGRVTLTAPSGDVAEAGGTIQAGTLSGSAAGRAAFASAGNAIATVGSFNAGGALTILTGGSPTVTGPLAASRIDLEAPGTVTLAGGSLTALQPTDAGAFASSLRLFPTSDPASAGIYIKTGELIQTGVTTVNPNVPFNAASANPPVLRIDLTGAAPSTVTFAQLDAPSTQLFLLLGAGSASGTINVGGLHVAIDRTGGGAATLTGMVAGRQGTGAANIASIAPVRNGRYRINACPIQSINCILLSPVLVPITNPVQDVEVGAGSTRQDDPDTIFPNVAEQDF